MGIVHVHVGCFVATQGVCLTFACNSCVHMLFDCVFLLAVCVGGSSLLAGVV